MTRGPRTGAAGSSRSRAAGELRALVLAARETRPDVVTATRSRLALGMLEPVAAEIARALLAQGAIS